MTNRLEYLAADTQYFDGIDIEQDVFASTLQVDLLFSKGKENLQVTPLSKFPTVQRDLALLVDDVTIRRALSSR